MPRIGRHLGFLAGAPLVGGDHAFVLFDGAPDAPGRIFREPDTGELDPPRGFGRWLAALDATHVLVGYPRGTGAPGRVLVLDVTTGAITATLTAPTPVDGDHFGHAIALTPTTIVVGAPFGDLWGEIGLVENIQAGAVHVFDRVTLAWQHTFTGASPTPGDLFGHSVATAGTTLVVGAPGEHPNAPFEGAAHVFDVATGALVRRIANPSAPFDLDGFGFAVAALPDRVVVGAPFDNTLEESGYDLPYAGTAYVFGLDGVLLQTSFGGYQRASLGWSMAALGRGVAIGAPSPMEGAELRCAVPRCEPGRPEQSRSAIPILLEPGGVRQLS